MGEWTYMGRRGNSVIDYVIGDEEVRGDIVRFEVGEGVELDNHPLIVIIGGGRGGRRRRNGREGGGWRGRGRWDVEGKESFKRKMEGLVVGEGGIQEEMEQGGERIRRTLEETEREGEGRSKGGRVGWWDRECVEKKREVRRALRGWRKGREKEEGYKKEKGEYKEMCERKKKEENEKWIRMAEEAKTEKQVWEVISRERKVWKKVSRDIGMEEWKSYFMGLLGGG